MCANRNLTLGCVKYRSASLSFSVIKSSQVKCKGVNIYTGSSLECSDWKLSKWSLVLLTAFNS